MQPFSPVLIVFLFAIGLGLAAYAVVASPGAPLSGGRGPGVRAAEARGLEPMRVATPGGVKLSN